MIRLPFNQISIPQGESFTLDYWERFFLSDTKLRFRILGQPGSPTAPALEWDSNGNVTVYPNTLGAPTTYKTGLRPFSGRDAHHRVSLVRREDAGFATLLFGCSRENIAGGTEGVFFSQRPRLMMHYRLDDDVTLVGSSSQYPVDQLGNQSGSAQVTGKAELGSFFIRHFSDLTDGVRLRHFSTLYLGWSHDTLFRNGGVFVDFVVDFDASVDIRLEELGATFLRLVRVHPLNAFTITYRDAQGAPQNATINVPGLTGFKHVIFGYSFVHEQLVVGVDGTLYGFPLAFTEQSIDQAKRMEVVLAAYSLTGGTEARLCNFRVWDAALDPSGGSYTVPQTSTAQIPEFSQGKYGIALDLAKAPIPTEFRYLEIYHDGSNPSRWWDVNDVVYHAGTEAYTDDGTYEVPQIDKQFTRLRFNEKQTVSVRNIQPTFDYPNRLATVSFDLYYPFSLTDVEIRVLYSFDGELWRDAPSGSSANQTTGLTADATAPSYSYVFDIRGIISQEERDLYIAVIARSASANVTDWTSPRANAVKNLAGPEQSIPSVDHPLTLVSPVSGVVDVDFTLYDRDSQLCDIVPEYRLDGSNEWFPAVSGPGGSGATGLASSPSGVAHVFKWDTTGIRAKWALFRITPKKKEDNDARVVADYRFNEPLVSAWTFEDALGAIPSVSRAVPAGAVNEFSGNAGTTGTAEIDATAPLWSGSSYLKLTTDASGEAALPVPFDLFTRDKFSKGLSVDLVYYLETTQANAAIEILSAYRGRKLLRLVIDQASQEISVPEIAIDESEYGSVSIPPVVQATIIGGAWKNLSFSLADVGSSSLRMVAYTNSGKAFDFTYPRRAALFGSLGDYGFRVVLRAEGPAASEVVRFDQVLLTNWFHNTLVTMPARTDPRNLDLYEEQPQSLDGVLRDHFGNNVLFTDGPFTSGLRYGSGGVRFPDNRLIRGVVFKHGVGFEFFVKRDVPTDPIGLLISDSNVPQTLINFSSSVSGGSCSVYTSAAAFDTFTIPANFIPSDSNWHHFRLSIRKSDPYLLNISVDGGQPLRFFVSALPYLFSYGPGFSLTFPSGSGDIFLSALRVWDGYHTTPYDPPTDDEPDFFGWNP